MYNNRCTFSPRCLTPNFYARIDCIDKARLLFLGSSFLLAIEELINGTIHRLYFFDLWNSKLQGKLNVIDQASGAWITIMCSDGNDIYFTFHEHFFYYFAKYIDLSYWKLLYEFVYKDVGYNSLNSESFSQEMYMI